MDLSLFQLDDLASLGATVDKWAPYSWILGSVILLACLPWRPHGPTGGMWWKSKSSIDVLGSIILACLPTTGWSSATAWGFAIILSVLAAALRARGRQHKPILGVLAVWHAYYWALSGLKIWAAHGRYQMTICIIGFAVATVIFLSTLSVPQSGLDESLEVRASLWSKATFSWVDPVIRQGYRDSHTMSTVPSLVKDDAAKDALECYRAYVKTCKPNRRMLYLLLGYFSHQLLLQGLWAAFHACLVFAAPTFLRLLLDEISKRGDPGQTEDDALGLLYVLGLSLGTCLASIAQGQALFIGRRIAVHVRAIVIGEIFDKAQRRKDLTVSAKNSEGEASATTGKIVNLIAVDAFKIGEVCAYIHYVWCELPLIIVLAICSLYLLLGPSALAAVVVLLLSSPFNYTVSWLFSRIQNQLLQYSDQRVNMTNEILGNVRIVKYFAWEDRFKKMIGKVRAKELQTLRKRFLLWAAGSLLWTGIGPMVAIAVFFTYTVLAGEKLTATKAFTSLSLLSILRSPFDQLIEMVSQILQVKVSIDRVDAFMREDETAKYLLSAKAQATDGPLVGFSDDATFSYSSDQDSFTLKNLNIQFPTQGLSLIVGRTGSGKTSLLMALLGELECSRGRVHLPFPAVREHAVGHFTESVAYAAQSPWLLSASLKHNILFGSAHDEKRFRAVLEACALSADLAVFPNGEDTEVGERGVTMSGGQKARISLARAIYSNSRYLLLDDVLSAVDAHTAKHIHKHLLTGPLMAGRCCILVTHAVGLCAREAQRVIVLESGEVIANGTYEEVLSLGLLQDSKDEYASADLQESQQPKEEPLPQSRRPEPVTKTKLIKDEYKAQGSVDWQYYKLYLTSLGTWPFWIAIFFLYILVQSLDVAAQAWLRTWSAAYDKHASRLASLTIMRDTFLRVSPAAKQEVHYNSEPDVAFYLGLYALISMAFILTNSFRNLCTFFGSLRASRLLYAQMLDAVLGARVRFFDETPLGRLMNRFSKDMQTVDQEIATMLILFVAQTVACIAILLVISYATPPFIGAAVIIIGIYWLISLLYLKSSRELKRLESINLSPLYSGFGEMLQGVTTVRAYSDEQRFRDQNLERIDIANRAFWWLWACNRWLSIRIDFAGALISLSAGIFVLYNQSIDAGLAGLSLTYAISWTGYVLWVIRLYSQCELNLNSVERVSEYLEIEQEEDPNKIRKSPPAAWPTDQAGLRVEKLVVRYSKDLPPVLKSISFNCRPTERIGIVGRTGSGKSTLALSMFRFVEAESGSIWLDGIDISTIGLRDLRSRLSIIPQDAVLFQGTIRSNLDPFDQFDDNQIWDALKRTQMAGVSSRSASAATTALSSRTVSSRDLNAMKSAGCALAQSTNGKDANGDHDPASSSTDSDSQQAADTQSTVTSLEQTVTESGKNFSTGQRQLLALARGLLQNNRILILDEATASLDAHTDTAIQETLRSEFENCLMLTIAHRLKTVIDYDRILVLDNGSIVEFDTPAILLQKERGVFRRMCEQSGEWEQLRKVHTDR